MREQARACAHLDNEVVLADLQGEAAARIAGDICASGGKASASPLDVTDDATIRQIIETLKANDCRARELIRSVVFSKPFLEK